LAPELQQQIDRAIERAQQYLEQQAPQQPEGYASLVAVALLKSGVSRESPVLRDLLTRISDRVQDGKFTPGSHHVYDAGVTLMALASADPVGYRPQIEAIARFLIEHQGPQGDWDYPNRTHGDTSISQYAMLGLWEAARAGVAVPPEVWDRAARWHVTRQVSDGGFAYHPSPTGNTGGSLHSMTAAGVGSLLIARRHLYPNAVDHRPEEVAPVRDNQRKYGVLEPLPPEEGTPAELKFTSYVPQMRLAAIDKSIDGGLAWLQSRFTVDQPSGHPIYYLYGLERSMALANLHQIGEHDWYLEGAEHLVRTQAPDGSWSDSSSSVAGACFGVLFLSRATAKMLGRTRGGPNFGAGLLAGGRGLPDNLADVQLEAGRLTTRSMPGALNDLLAELENPQSLHVEAAQAGVVETVLLDPAQREQLVGQTDRLLKLIRDPRIEVRRTAAWALGRGGNLRIAPALIAALEDADESVRVEARNALLVLSRKIASDQSADPVYWREWYRSVQPYDERDRPDRALSR